MSFSFSIPAESLVPSSVRADHRTGRINLRPTKFEGLNLWFYYVTAGWSLAPRISMNVCSGSFFVQVRASYELYSPTDGNIISKAVVIQFFIFFQSSNTCSSGSNLFGRRTVSMVQPPNLFRQNVSRVKFPVLTTNCIPNSNHKRKELRRIFLSG